MLRILKRYSQRVSLPEALAKALAENDFENTSTILAEKPELANQILPYAGQFYPVIALAAIGGDVSTIRLLVEHFGVDPVQCDENGMSGKDWAAEWGKSKEWQTAMLAICKLPNIEIGIVESKEYNSDMSQKLLHMLGRYPDQFTLPDADKAVKLVEKGADPNVVGESSVSRAAWPLINFLAYHDFAEHLQIALRFGANTEVVTDESYTHVVCDFPPEYEWRVAKKCTSPLAVAYDRAAIKSLVTLLVFGANPFKSFNGKKISERKYDRLGLGSRLLAEHLLIVGQMNRSIGKSFSLEAATEICVLYRLPTKNKLLPTPMWEQVLDKLAFD